jgi:hypothetical protein
VLISQRNWVIKYGGRLEFIPYVGSFFSPPYGVDGGELLEGLLPPKWHSTWGGEVWGCGWRWLEQLQQFSKKELAKIMFSKLLNNYQE